MVSLKVYSLNLAKHQILLDLLFLNLNSKNSS